MADPLMSDLEGLASLLSKFSGQEDQLRSAVATRIHASGVAEISEAYETMGAEAARLYIPMSRQAIKAQRDLQRVQHEAAMQDLDRREREAKVKMVEAQANR